MELNNFYKHVVSTYEYINKNIKYSIANTKINKKIITDELFYKTIIKYINIPNFLNEIPEKEFNIFNDFFENLENMSDEHFITFMNQHGRPLQEYIYDLIETKNLPNTILDVINDISLFSEFTCINILNEILTHDFYVFEYLIQFENTTCNLKLITKKKISKKEIQKIICRIFLIQTMFPNYQNKFNVNLYFTDQKKKLPKYKILGINEINSGVSIGDINVINIFRKEEMLKLLIHEIIHNLDIDNSLRNNTTDFSKYFNIPREDNYIINESYTEFLAVLINSMIFSFEDNNDYNYTLFIKIIENEKQYTLYQNAKILNHYGFKSIDDFNKPNDNELYKQNTSVFSYFFLKGALLFNYREFFKIVYTLSDKLKWKPEYSTLFIRILLENSKDTKFLNAIQKYLNLFSSNKSHQLYNKYTLRMTYK